MEQRRDTIIFEIRCHVPEVNDPNFINTVQNLGIESLGGYAEKFDEEAWIYRGNLVKLGRCYFTALADEQEKRVVLEPIEWQSNFKKLVNLPIKVNGKHQGQEYYFEDEKSVKQWLKKLNMIDRINYMVSVPEKYFGSAIMYLI